MIEYRFDQIDESAVRRRAWIKSLSPMLESYVDPDDFFPRTVYHRHYNLKSIVFGEAKLSAQSVERTNSIAAIQNIDHLMIGLNLRGRSCVTVEGNDTEIGNDTFVFSDLSRPLKFITSGSAALTLLVPQRLLIACGDATVLHGRTMPVSSGPLTTLLANHMKKLATCLGAATPSQKEHIAAATLALCNAMFLPSGSSAHNHAAIGSIAIRQFIDRNFATADAEMLMAEFKLSRKSLYKLFEAEGGVYAYIRSRRLAHALRQLVRTSDGRRLTIKQLTYVCGFQNEQVFSRAFRRKYGCNPSEVDPSGRPRANWDGSSSRLMAWIKGL